MNSPNPRRRYLHYMYVRQLVLPFQLSCDWSYKAFPLLESWHDPRLLLPLTMYAFVLFVIVVAWQSVQSSSSSSSMKKRRNDEGEDKVTEGGEASTRQRQRRQDGVSVIVATLGLGVLPFVPSSNLLFPVATVLGERLLYLPSMGFVILLAMLMNYMTKS